jgi:hypothetical protein
MYCKNLKIINEESAKNRPKLPNKRAAGKHSLRYSPRAGDNYTPSQNGDTFYSRVETGIQNWFGSWML